MATSLKKFTAGELAAVLGDALKRGRPSFELRAALEDEVKMKIAIKQVGVRKGKLVRL
jgi:hypothetical protein